MATGENLVWRKIASGKVTSREAIRRPSNGSAGPPTAIRRLSAGYPTAHFVTLLFWIRVYIRCHMLDCSNSYRMVMRCPDGFGMVVWWTSKCSRGPCRFVFIFDENENEKTKQKWKRKETKMKRRQPKHKWQTKRKRKRKNASKNENEKENKIENEVKTKTK